MEINGSASKKYKCSANYGDVAEASKYKTMKKKRKTTTKETQTSTAKVETKNAEPTSLSIRRKRLEDIIGSSYEKVETEDDVVPSLSLRLKCLEEEFEESNEIVETENALEDDNLFSQTKETETINEKVETENAQTTSIFPSLESLKDDNILLTPELMAYEIYMEEQSRNVKESDSKEPQWKLLRKASRAFSKLSEARKVHYASIYKEKVAEEIRKYEEEYWAPLSPNCPELSDHESDEKGIQDDDYAGDDDDKDYDFELTAYEKGLEVYLTEFVAKFKMDNPYSSKKHREIISEGEYSFGNLSDEERATYAKRYDDGERWRKRGIAESS